MENMTREARGQGRQDGRWELWGLLLVLTAAGLRLWFVATSQFELIQDEAQYWDWSRRLQLSYYSKGPLVAYVIAAGTAIFGNTEIGVRFPALACSLLTQLVVLLGVSRLLGRPREAFWAVLAMSTSPFFLVYGLMMTTDNPLMLFWSVSLFSLWAAGEGRGGRLPFVLLGMCMALGVLAKYMMLALAGIALLYGLGLRRAGGVPEGFWRRLALSLGVGTAVGMLPILAWNLQSGFVGFKHVGSLAGVTGKKAETILRLDRFPEFFGSQIGLLTPWWLAFAVHGGWLAARRFFRDDAAAWALGRRESLLLACSFWPLFGFFVLWSFHTRVYGNWPAMSYIGAFALAGVSFARFLERAEGRLASTRKLWPALSCLVALIFYAQNALPLNTDWNPATRFKGWSDLGREVGRLRDERFQAPDKVFVFSDSYDMTAELAFYVPGQPRSYSANLGRRMTQYDLWPGPADKLGWDAVYVRRDEKAGVQPGLDRMFDRVERQVYRSEHMGRPARVFTIYLCYGFNGQWPGPPSNEF